MLLGLNSGSIVHSVSLKDMKDIMTEIVILRITNDEEIKITQDMYVKKQIYYLICKVNIIVNIILDSI